MSEKISPRRIYLDNSATSWPKPPVVYEAVDHFQRELGAPAGRSAHRHALQTSRKIAATRGAIAKLLGVPEPNRIVFTCNGTDSLNLAIHGLLSPGDHVVTTVAEHNSVLRPLRFLEETIGIQVTRVGCDSTGTIYPEDVREAMRPETKLVAIIHASNVTGAIQPVQEIGQIVAATDAFFLVDAAQTIGHIPINVDTIGADLLAAPGHKSLYGPLGTGLLYIREGVEQVLRPIRQGGTGTDSEDDRQPDSLPEKYESGNLNALGIAGLQASLEFLSERRIETLHAQISALTTRLIDGLSNIQGVVYHGPDQPERRVAVVSVTLPGYDPQEVAAMLDGTYGIEVRAGFHCAPAIHEPIGSADCGGTVRISLGAFNTADEVDEAVLAVKQIAAESMTDC